jgi:mRNA-degrading endonuclease RelE of RelBE toxin-antitoxin system
MRSCGPSSGYELEAGLDTTSSEGLKKTGQRQARRIREAVKRFAETGHGDLKKLTDVNPPEWRQRVGDWRVFLQPHAEQKELHVLRVKKRDQAY